MSAVENQSGAGGPSIQPRESPKQHSSLVTSLGQADREGPGVTEVDRLWLLVIFGIIRGHMTV